MMRDGLVPLLEAHWREFDGSFVWGRRDCGMFAARWVEKVTGLVILEPLGAYKTKGRAHAILKQHNWADMREVADAYLSRREIGFARLGDIVAREFSDTGWSLGICNRRAAAFVTRAGGITQVALNTCAYAWTVEPAAER